MTEADLMVLLTNIDGIYKEDPRKNSEAEFISLVEVIDNNLEKLADDTSGYTTTGGMITKIEAVKKASVFGVTSVIANGTAENVILKIFNGEEVGTLILPSKDRLSARKHWIAFNLQVSGTIIVDKGASDAVSNKGKSLLPSGIKEVRGKFGIGDAVLCVDESGNEIARGITSYSSEEIKKITGVKTNEVEKILGYKYSDEVIHRDDLAVIGNSEQKI